MMAKMRSIATLSTLLVAMAMLGGGSAAGVTDVATSGTGGSSKSSKSVAKPYLVFRQNCDEDDEEDDSKSRSAANEMGEYAGNGYHYSGDGYSPYPDDNGVRTRYRRALNGGLLLGNEQEDEKAAASNEKASSSASNAKRREEQREQPQPRELASKCSKATKATKASKSSKSSKSGTKSSKSSTPTSARSGDDDANGSPSDSMPSDGSPSDSVPSEASTPSAGYPSYPTSSTNTGSTPSGPVRSVPTLAPVENRPITKESSCDAISKGEPNPTPKEANLKYRYEAAISEGVNERTVRNSMEGNLAKFVGKDLMECEDVRRRKLLEEKLVGKRLLSGIMIVGIDATTPKDKKIDDKDCTYFKLSREIPDTECHVIEGGMTLYLGEYEDDSEWRQRRKLTEEDDEAYELWTTFALEAIMEAMNVMDPSPFLDGSEVDEGKYAVDGLMGLRFMAGSTHNGEEVIGGGGGGDRNIDGGKGEVTTQSSKMETVGISLLAVGLAVLVALALAFVVVRKRRNANDRYNEFNDDDYNDLDMDKKTDLDELSLTSSPRAAYVVGEDASMYTSATHNTLMLVNSSREYGNGNDDNEQVDVHHCTSALCPICNGKETVFVNAIDDQSEVETTYDQVNQSFQYEPKEEISSPRFQNPSEIERPYVVENTIDF
eukprot:CAMPEP_0183717338 /NCGR_PEP_ID=MMETSP0737-20130205/10976_1 /TAXON_ID=385413 /ORGANISM="Thalassiosira miniscula, Strain CCMP1093" /LENGTH=659 /DNA_ID=CAMNT_0025946757 /DNA_START=34 /DNA_END=2013 /DNA_ORIENTATION=-